MRLLTKKNRGKIMKKNIVTLIVAASMSACSFNVSTGTNNTPSNSATPAANASPATENKAVNTTNTAAAPKKEEADSAKKSEPASSSANSVRVQFAKGETSTSVTKDIPAKGSVDFVINVKKGQKMGFTVGYDFNDDDVNYALYEPDTKDVTMSAGPKELQEFEVKMNGDHRLTVNNTTGKKVTITLYLDVE